MFFMLVLVMVLLLSGLGNIPCAACLNSNAHAAKGMMT